MISGQLPLGASPGLERRNWVFGFCQARDQNQPADFWLARAGPVAVKS